MRQATTDANDHGHVICVSIDYRIVPPIYKT